MNRRRMLSLLAGAPLLASTQGVAIERVRRVGMLNLTTPSNAEAAKVFSTLLRALGWVEGSAIAIWISVIA